MKGLVGLKLFLLYPVPDIASKSIREYILISCEHEHRFCDGVTSKFVFVVLVFSAFVKGVIWVFFCPNGLKGNISWDNTEELRTKWRLRTSGKVNEF